MIVRQSFDQRFCNRIKELEERYGTEMFDLDGIGDGAFDISAFTHKFLTNSVAADISSDPNANVDDQSVVVLENEFNKSSHRLNAYHILWERMVNHPDFGIKRANKALELCIRGTLKIHDQHHWFRPYCYAFSVEPIVSTGLTYIKKVKIEKPKHVISYINQVIQFLAFASNQIAGAAAFPDFFVFLDWYCRQDYGEDYLEDEFFRKQLEQHIQSFVFSTNYPYRSTQASFVNISIFDRHFLKDLFLNVTYPDFSKPNLDSIMKLQEFYARWFIEESKRQSFTFPVNTACFYSKDGKIQDTEFLDMISELNSYNGTFNIYTGELGKLSSCCRLINDSKAFGYTNSFGAGGVSIGSHRVVTINFPQLAMEAEDNQDFMKRLDYATLMAQDILQVHRELIVEIIGKGKLPLYKHGYMHLNKQFSTIGFIGINEAIEILGMDITKPSGKEFAIVALNRINELNQIKAKKLNTIWNMEQIPGESAAFVLAKKDKHLFKNHKYDMYSNQYIPLWKNVDIEKRLVLAGTFDRFCSGGAITHITTSDSLVKEQMKCVIETAAANGVIYFAVNMAQCRCKTCGKLYIGKFEKSPCHHAEVIKYLRIVGFLTPVSDWAAPRREEYEHRQFYKATDFKT
jgi:anaerobic ribonucleoside-triphosphate reductase